MKNFIKNLLSSRSGTSSKRFAALFTLINLIILAYIATFAAPDNVVPKFIYDALVIIVSGGLGLTVLEKIWGRGDANAETDKDKSDNDKDTTEPVVDIVDDPCPCKDKTIE
jgi:hypothetical protein